MTTRSPYDHVRVVLDVHAMIHGFLLQAVEDVPQARMTEQPGTMVNHPAWTLSHLLAFDGLLLSMLGDQGVPATEIEMQKYGYGTTPVPDPAAYLTKSELLARSRERHQHLAAVVAERHAEYFPRPAPAMYQAHAPTIGHIATTLLIAHGPHHLGQLKQWRRAAGFGTN